MFKKYLFIALTLLLSFSATSQNQKKIDSLLYVYEELPDDTLKVNIIDDIINYYRVSDTSKLRSFITKQLQLSEDIGFKKGVAKGFENYAKYYRKKRKEDSIIFYYDKALKIYENINFVEGQTEVRYKMGDGYRRVYGYEAGVKFILENIAFYKKNKNDKYLAKSYDSEAQAHFFNDRYKLALDRGLKALKYFEKTKDSSNMLSVYQTLSYVECELDNNEKALEYAVKCLNYKDKSNKSYFAGMYNTMGIIYTQQKDFKRADSIFNKGFGIAVELDWSYMQKLILVNHGRSYEERNDYKSALQKAEDYIKIENKSRDNSISSLGPLSKGVALVNLNRASEAKVYLDKALDGAKQENLKRRLIPTYKNRAEANAKLDNYKEAFEDYKMYTVLKDSVFNKTKSQQIEELRTIYETEKKEQQIQNQKNEIELLATREKLNNFQLILLALALALTLIVAYAFYQRNKNNKLAKEKVEAELEFKTKELTTHALHLAKKNEVLNDLKEKAKVLKADADADPGYQMLIQTINFDLQDDNNWENFSRYFEQVHKGFNSKAKKQFPNVTKNDLRLMALLKMNLTSKEIANVLNISSGGIKKARQRLRKKMKIDSNESLEAVIISIQA